MDAPTTAGKTRVVEFFFRHNLKNPSFRAAYTTPVKSLSNDKYREFIHTFGKENVGIATGDTKENLNAPIVVCTLECYRNSLLGVEPDLGRSIVIFDEYHYVQDSSRGSAWEEALILSPKTCQLLLLSATVANPNDFGHWIESLGHKRTFIVQTIVRPVPLKNLVYFQDHWISDEVSKPPRPIKKGGGGRRDAIPIPKIARMAVHADEIGLTPLIVYFGNRSSCEILADELPRHCPPLPEDQQKKLEAELKNLDEIYKSFRFINKKQLTSIIRFGAAFHHSGLTPAHRLTIEILLKKGLLKYCVSTMGLSLGVNFSVRSALIADSTRPSDGGPTRYADEEILQMTGRAGRRGSDHFGFTLWPSAESYYKFSNAKRPVCGSNLKIEPTTLLNLIGRGYSIRGCETFYNKSLMAFQNKKQDYFKIVERKGKSGQPFDNPLNTLYHHLHRIDCLDSQEKLTELGKVARYFPQAGGLLVADWIVKGVITAENLLESMQIVSMFTLARHKSPKEGRHYVFPADIDSIEKRAEMTYPIDLFPNLYDPPYGSRHYPVLREFNPVAGYVVSEWARGADWQSMKSRTVGRTFAEGDLIQLLYRTATYLQSMSQLDLGALSQSARALLDIFLREPLGLENRA